MDTTQFNAHRLHNQYLTAAVTNQSSLSAYEVVSRLGAMQAQDYYGSLWAIGSRTGLTERQVINTVESRLIVRTWPQRGTLHYVAAEDVAWMTGLSAARLVKGAKRRHENLGLDQATLDRSKTLFAQALEGGKTLNRLEMLELLEADGISTKSGRGYHMLWYAAQTGLTYIGPMKSKKQTFGLLQDLPVKQRQLERDEAATELARRYFTSHGPAMLQDFIWWSGLTSMEAKSGLAANARRLQSITIDGHEYWQSADAELSPPTMPKTILLPGFDEYILGYKDRGLQMKPEYFARIVPGGNGMFMPSVIANGQVVGTWKRTLKKDKLTIGFELFAQQPAAIVSDLKQRASAFGAFLGAAKGNVSTTGI